MYCTLRQQGTVYENEQASRQGLWRHAMRPSMRTRPLNCTQCAVGNAAAGVRAARRKKTRTMRNLRYSLDLFFTSSDLDLKLKIGRQVTHV